MLLIKCLSSILLLLPIFVLSLPVHDINNKIEYIQNDQQTPFINPTDIKLQHEQEKEENFLIDTTRFTHMLSSHIMIEHLETAISILSKRLASQVQNTVKLNIQQQQQNHHHHSYDYNEVDIELLLDQLQAAIASFVQDQLPSMWYGHSSSNALDSTPLKEFMEKKLYDFCFYQEQQDNNNDIDDDDEGKIESQEKKDKIIDYQCLKSNTYAYLDKVDSYIKEQMHYTLAEMVQQDVPALLNMVDNQVRAVLHHFNTYLLPPSTQVHLKFISLQEDPNWSNLSSMDEILDIIASVEKNEKISHSVLHYASLSKST
ncbi:hypothetical protein BJ944DRAFT_273377 [Cunninghamella echinulata]|nr:hypothetical protein BJ944DRAFT_273377 [Cunninghamella echinulata]